MTRVCWIVARCLYSQCGFGLSCVITSLSLFPALLENKTNVGLMALFSLSLHFVCSSLFLSIFPHLSHFFPLSCILFPSPSSLSLCHDVVDQNEGVTVFGSLNHMRSKHSQLLYNSHTNTHIGLGLLLFDFKVTLHPKFN